LVRFFFREAPMGLDAQWDAPNGAPKTGFAGRLEIVSGPSGRGRWPDAVKALVVADSYRPGARVADVARAHGVTRGQVYQWRSLARRGLLVLPEDDDAPLDFASLVVEPESAVTPAALVGSADAVIEIVVCDVVIRAPERAGAEHLARAIRAARLAAQ
jgi:transposase